MSKEKKQGISRRAFMKSAAAAGAGAIAMTGGGLLAAEKEAVKAATISKPKYLWETPPDPIPDSKIKEKVMADIIVIGCGISGITAALSANEEGAKTIIIEKHRHYNCRGGDQAVIDSRVQKELGVKVDKDEVCLALQKYAGNRSDQRFLRLWADNSGRIMDWLLEITDPTGLELTLKSWPYPDGWHYKNEYYPEFPVDHYFTGGSDGLMAVLVPTTLKRGVDIRYNTRAVQLIRKDKGRVAGVIAQDKDGNYVQYNALKGVILCTGEYGHDEEMMEAYCPWAAEFAEDSPYYPPVNTGDGHKMAMWIGGVMEPAPHPPMDHSSGGPMGVSAFLHVNTLGERYENEDIDCQVISNGMKRQPGNTFWQVYDSKWEDEIGKMGFGFMKGSSRTGGEGGAPPGEGGASGGIVPGAASAGRGGAPAGVAGGVPGGAGGAPGRAEGVPGYPIPQDFDRAGAPPQGKKVQAYTIEELARKMEVPVDTFKKTVERYNYLAKIGKDLDFGKRADRLTTIDKPPFYAGNAVIGFLVALGGLYVNTRLQLLDEDRKPIEGIYLAGNTVGNRFACDYTIMCPGLSHAFAWLTGYLAAKSALGVPDPAWEQKKA